jgi:hypothetical protein
MVDINSACFLSYVFISLLCSLQELVELVRIKKLAQAEAAAKKK